MRELGENWFSCLRDNFLGLAPTVLRGIRELGVNWFSYLRKKKSKAWYLLYFSLYPSIKLYISSIRLGVHSKTAYNMHRSRWPWRWSWCVNILMVLMMVIVMVSAGIVMLLLLMFIA